MRRYATIRTADGRLYGTPYVSALLELLPDPTAVVVITERGDQVHIPVRAITAVTVSDRP